MRKVKKLIAIASSLVKHRWQVVKFLDFTANPTQAFSGTVQRHELFFIQQIVNKANQLEGPILEIGTLFGFTTQHIAEWKHSDKQLSTVDNFQWNPIGLDSATHKEFTSRILYYLKQKSSLVVFEGSNTEFYNSYDGPTPSMVFIDAGHSYEDVMVDIKWAISQQIPLISGHDYSKTQLGVTRAVNEFFGEDNIRVEGSVWFYHSAGQ